MKFHLPEYPTNPSDPVLLGVFDAQWIGHSHQAG
jgi:hypothetical protein